MKASASASSLTFVRLRVLDARRNCEANYLSAHNFTQHDCPKYVYRGWRDEADCGFIEGRIEMELLACDESLQISWHKKSKFLCFCHPKMDNAIESSII